jgi:hypothetical protein
MVGASPDALLSYERLCADMDSELVAAGARMRASVSAWSTSSVGSCSAVGVDVPDVGRFARDALAHDRRVGRTGRRFCDADASYAFDAWTRAEVASYAAGGSFGDGEVGGLLDRLRVEGLDDLAEAVAARPAPKRGFFAGVWEGVSEGSFDEAPFADGWGQFGKAVGQLASGLAIYGDVRDSIAEYSRGNWLGGTWDLAGAVPGLGDAAKILGFGLDAASIVRRADEVVDAAHHAARAADAAQVALVRGGGLRAHELAGGHTIAAHVEPTVFDLRQRVATDPTVTGATRFYDLPTAERAIEEALAGNADKISKVLDGRRRRQELVAVFDGPIGHGFARGSSELVEVNTLRVFIVAAPDAPLGFIVETAHPWIR